MKNALQYYYGITISTIHQKEKRYMFEIDQKHYVFLPCDRNLDEVSALYQISTSLHQVGVYCHEMIMNQQGSIVTYVNQTPYILMRVFVKPDDVIIVSDIISFQNKTKNISNQELLMRHDWYQLWTTKIDYFEYQVSQLSKKYPRIRESFSYFVGLAENSISLYEQLVKKDYHDFSISHKRIHAGDTLFDLFNPLNFIIDFSSRDASEYFKSAFLYQKDIINEIIYYLSYSNLNEYERQMFFVRLLFPTHYFDIYEDIITGDSKEKELLKIVTFVNQYEQLLRQVYEYMRLTVYLPEIEWLTSNRY